MTQPVLEVPSAALSSSGRVGRLRTGAVGLLVIAGVVNYFDRSALSIANPLIRRDLHLSIGQMGLLLSAFAWSYGAAQIPAGMLVDRFGARRVLSIGLLVWSAAQMAAAVCVTLPQMIGARVALGFGESPMYTGGTRVCAEWYPQRLRVLPIAVFNASASLGPAVAPAVLTLLILRYGWRIAFVLLGVLGVAIALAWVAFYRAPDQARLAPEERALTGAAEPVEAVSGGRGRLRRLLGLPYVWAMTAGFFGVIYMTWLYATWLPGYLEDQRHLSLHDAGLLTSVPLTAGFLGALAAGFSTQALIRRGASPVAACRLQVAAAMVLTAVATVGAALVAATGLSVALLSVGVFAANFASSAGWALGAVIVPAEDVASLEAIQNVGGSVGGALAPALTGYVVQATGSFTPALMVAAAIAAGTAVIYAWAVREPALPAPGPPALA